ncbi:MAG TPA: asparagine synthase (glutamine-hydrolyzing), partial [Gemmatimonadaceae bacterium]
MIAALRHRGPDDCGAYQDGRIALGMSRLKIIDVTQAGHQPMSNAEQTVTVVYNGEMFNFRAERKVLEEQGHTFSSSSDTEVVLRLYERYGDDFLCRMRGMFALAIYDRRRGPGKERLLLARDHLGIKPLLYAEVGGRLVFASELKALIASGLIDRAVDPEALRVLLTFGSIYQPRTMLRDVRMLMPGHRMIVEGAKSRIERYWSLGTDRCARLRSLPYAEQVQALSDAVAESVRLHMVSDVPLGAFLSGGVDSSILVALMAREAGQRIKTFSVGFETEGAHIDESNEARATARFLGTDHTHVQVRGESVRDELRTIAGALDQPSVDGVNSYFVSRAA